MRADFNAEGAETRSGLKANEPGIFRVGDSVTWTHVVTTADGGKVPSSIRMKSRSGTIESVDNAERTVRVKVKNGRRLTVALDALRHKGQKSALTEFFENL
jgi:hypothetical protein